MKIEQHGMKWIKNNNKDSGSRELCPECNSDKPKYAITKKIKPVFFGKGDDITYKLIYQCNLCACEWSYERSEEYK